MSGVPVWPEWWHWELRLSPHALRRMVDRRFTETDLRLILDDAGGYGPNHEPGRWFIRTFHDHREWEVIVEPLPDEHVLLVITAYPLGFS